jgi:type I restriction enzyme M protein
MNFLTLEFIPNLWIFNKNKTEERKDKVMLINASDLFVPLKKSKGKKRKEMNVDNRAAIVNALTNFVPNDFCKVFDKWHFYYNKQSIMLTNVDDKGNAIEMPNKVASTTSTSSVIKGTTVAEPVEAKSIKIEIKTITTVDLSGENKTINETEITEFDKTVYSSLQDYFEKYYKAFVNDFDYKDDAFVLFDKQGNSYGYCNKRESIKITDTKQAVRYLGNGKIVIKSTFKKASKTKAAHILITAELTKDL